MKLSEKNLKQIIREYKLDNRKDIISFIENNPENISINELSRIAEIVNNKRVDTAAYYTDFETLKMISKQLPEINKDEIYILEPSVGVGNFIQIIIDKYKTAKKLIIEVNDIDYDSIQITKALNQHREIPSNVSIVYTQDDFVTRKYDKKFDLIIGNPPFLKLTRNNGLRKYSIIFKDNITTNVSGFFIQKSCDLAEYVVMIMPKYLLNNPDFLETRKRINRKAIDTIIDFGEIGFKGVLIETICLFIDTKKEKSRTRAISIMQNITNIIPQEKMTSDEFPGWLIYRDEFFDNIAQKLDFGIFNVFRDRQLTNSMIKKTGEVRVIKSRNISRDGSEIKDIPDYDNYIQLEDLKHLSVNRYLKRSDVFLSPNMTYYPRVIRKPENTVVNGSVAILEPNKINRVTDSNIKFLSSEIFEKFYRIARNYNTRSLNIDKNSVYFFGLLKENED